MLFLSCVCVLVSGVLLSVGVCVSPVDFLHMEYSRFPRSFPNRASGSESSVMITQNAHAVQICTKAGFRSNSG